MKFTAGNRVRVELFEESSIPEDVAASLDGETGIVASVEQDGSVLVKLDNECRLPGGLLVREHAFAPDELAPLVKVVVELEIAGDIQDALHVVDGLLDAGFFQDAINEHDDEAGDLHVTSAVCRADVRSPDCLPSCTHTNHDVGCPTPYGDEEPRLRTVD